MSETLEGGNAPTTPGDILAEVQSLWLDHDDLLAKHGELEREIEKVDKAFQEHLPVLLNKAFELFHPTMMLRDEWMLLPVTSGSKSFAEFAFDVVWAREFTEAIASGETDWDYPKDHMKCFIIASRIPLEALTQNETDGPTVKVVPWFQGRSAMRCRNGVWEILHRDQHLHFSSCTVADKQAAIKEGLRLADGGKLRTVGGPKYYTVKPERVADFWQDVGIR